MRACEQSPLVSVIVPVYNVEKYVNACLRSITEQSYQNLEIIVVDDGSTDGSGSICDEWECADSRISVIHRENSGLSDARNEGVSRSTGEYVALVDSDDLISPWYVETLSAAALRYSADIVAVPGGTSFCEETDIDLTQSLSVSELVEGAELLHSEDYLRRMLYQQCDVGAPFRLCKREVLLSNPFPSGLVYEDAATAFRHAQAAAVICVVDSYELYGYRIRHDSIMRSEYSPNKTRSALLVSRRIYDDVSQAYPQLSRAAASRCFSLCRVVYSQIPAGNTEDRNLIWGELVRYRGAVMSDVKARKRERLATMVSLLGQKPFSAFCWLYRKAGYSA